MPHRSGPFGIWAGRAVYFKTYERKKMMLTGKIKAIKGDRDFGFIRRYDDIGDLFFHRGDVLDDRFEALSEAMQVSFDVQDSDKGLRAVGVIETR